MHLLIKFSAEILLHNLKKGQKFIDPEFGPTENDKHGSKFIYTNGVKSYKEGNLTLIFI